jgi:cyclopropane fatty-acyl-phospholipid synthase-like methyltransferase
MIKETKEVKVFNKNFHWGKKPTKKLKEILEFLPKSGWALDLGAGCGGNSIFLAQKNLKVVAIDKRSEAIQCLKKELKKIKGPEVKVYPQRLELGKELWPNKNYSIILALNLLHFLSCRRANFLIERLKESLGKQGIIFIRVFSSKNKSRLKRYYPSPKILKQKFKNFEFLEFRHYRVQEDHPPLGPHAHWVIDLIAKKV